MWGKSKHGESLGRNLYLNPTNEEFRTHAMQLQQRTKIIENSQASISPGFRNDDGASLVRKDINLHRRRFEKNLCLNPTKEDFKTHTMQLQQKTDVIKNSQASNYSRYRNSVTIKRGESNLQEAMQRDQYILSTRQNRHIVFAAKYARTKNSGLTKVLEKNVRLLSREHERSLRQVTDYRNRLRRDLEALRERGNMYQLQHLEKKAAIFHGPKDYVGNVLPLIAQTTSSYLDSRADIESDLKSTTNKWRAQVNKAVGTNVTLPPL